MDDEDGGVMDQWMGAPGWLGWIDDECTGGRMGTRVVKPVAGLCLGKGGGFGVGVGR